MTMIAAEAVGDTVAPEATAKATAPIGKAKFSGAQKLGAVNKALPKPRTSHPYIVGLSLIIIGGFGLVGSITGSLPSMLAALFVPNALVDQSGASPSILSDITHGLFGIAKAVPDVVDVIP